MAARGSGGGGEGEGGGGVVCIFLCCVSAIGRIERDFRICRPFAFALHHFIFHFSIRQKETVGNWR